MENGSVKWFSDSKGYGFISRETENDIFVHYSSIDMNGRKTLHEGQQVQFEVEDGPKGIQATQVRTLEA